MDLVNFRSDNEAPVAPEIMAAIASVNHGAAHSYGEDATTVELTQRFSILFERDVTVFPLVTGTAANALALGHVTPPFGAIFCAEQSHVLVDECGAAGFYAGGALMRPLSSVNGKIEVHDLAGVLASFGAHGDHEAKPSTLTIAQATECGTLYKEEELLIISEVAKQHGIVFHMDGARFANAVSALDCHPADITWKVGVDILSFGATKNGALAAEAVIIFNQDLAAEFGRQRMRGGHLLSKMRYLSIQLKSYIENGLWLNLAERANKAAQRIASGLSGIPAVDICHPVEVNAIFVRFPEQMIERLTEEGFLFHRWPTQPGIVRLMCSYAITDDDIEKFLEAVRRHAPHSVSTL